MITVSTGMYHLKEGSHMWFHPTSPPLSDLSTRSHSARAKDHPNQSHSTCMRHAQVALQVWHAS